MKKNVIWWPALKNPSHLEKYGNFDYYEYSRISWEYWCKKNNCIFVPFTEPIENNFIEHRPQWQKCLYVFDELDRLGIEFDQVGLMDSTAIVKWDCPNFFEMTDRKMCGVHNEGSYDWIIRSIENYGKYFFNGHNMDFTKYIDCGFVIINDTHRDFFKQVIDFYNENAEIIIDEENPDYLIYSCFGKDFLTYNCIRIFYSGENMVPDFNLCDYGISFFYLEFEDRYIRYPNFMGYGSQADYLEEKRTLSFEGLKNKTKFVFLEKWASLVNFQKRSI